MEPHTASARVLVVDDEEVVRTFVDQVLRGAGYETVIASSGAEALRIAETSGPFDLLLADVAMPEIEGTELAKRLRQVDPMIKVLYLTGHRDRLFQDQTSWSQNDPFLEKPVTMRALRESVSLVLFGHRRGL